jgi:hypothetical protein
LKGLFPQPELSPLKKGHITRDRIHALRAGRVFAKRRNGLARVAAYAAQHCPLFTKSPREARSLLPQAVAEAARSLGAAATIFPLPDLLVYLLRYEICTSGAVAGRSLPPRAPQIVPIRAT